MCGARTDGMSADLQFLAFPRHLRTLDEMVVGAPIFTIGIHFRFSEIGTQDYVVGFKTPRVSRAKRSASVNVNAELGLQYETDELRFRHRFWTEFSPPVVACVAALVQRGGLEQADADAFLMEFAATGKRYVENAFAPVRIKPPQPNARWHGQHFLTYTAHFADPAQAQSFAVQLELDGFNCYFRKCANGANQLQFWRDQTRYPLDEKEVKDLEHFLARHGGQLIRIERS